MTYRQAQAMGAQIREGERGCPVVYLGAIPKRGADQSEAELVGDEEAREVRFLKTYIVFNVAQIDGLPDGLTVKLAPSPALLTPERLARADVFLSALGLGVRYGGAQAYYSVAEDRIQLPPLETFRDAEGYYATWGHEAMHAARHPSRLDRDFGRQCLATRIMPGRSWSPNWAAPSSRPILASTWSPERTTPPIWLVGSRC